MTKRLKPKLSIKRLVEEAMQKPKRLKIFLRNSPNLNNEPFSIVPTSMFDSVLVQDVSQSLNLPLKISTDASPPPSGRRTII